MQPLADKIRPHNIDEFVGQKHLVGKDKPIRLAVEQGHIFSFVLWGTPGTGKTTLARIYADAIKADFYELSAVSAGKDDIRKIVNKPREDGRPRVLFFDEIHRFNKAQQDFLLPFVESGELSFDRRDDGKSEFRSHSRVDCRACACSFWKNTRREDMAEIIDRTGFELDAEAKNWMIEMANGDARQAITMLSNTAQLYDKITVETLKETLQSKFLRYDKKGEEHYTVISAFIKSMRASQPDAAMYYLARMIEAGEDPKFIARRMVIFASEDIGLAQPTALVVANAVFRAVETIGLPEAGINLAHGVAYLSNCAKDRSAYDAYKSALDDARKMGNLPVPLHLRNAPTKLMKDLNYGEGYELYSKESFLPEKLKNKKYLKPKKKI